MISLQYCNRLFRKVILMQLHRKQISSVEHLTDVTFNNGVKTIQMCHSKTRNSLSIAMMENLVYNITRGQDDPSVRVIIITGVGPIFSAGHNLKELGPNCSRDEHQHVFSLASKLMHSVIDSSVPIIARVDGLAAAAGCQLVAQCDLAFCTEKSSFSTPGVNFGIFCSTPGIALEDDPWTNYERPFVNLINYDEFELNDEEKSGYLSQRIVGSCSSYLDKCPVTRKYALCKCVLTQKGLNDISMLYHNTFLQYVDLSWNNIGDLSALGNLPCLMYLDVSHNKVKELLDFKPPYNLTFVNYGHNLIRKIKDLSSFWSIKILNLSHNSIEVIEGLSTLKYLETLDLSYNKIKRIENLNLSEINYLQHLNLLISVNFNNNPIKQCPNYEFFCINTIKNLQLLDENPTNISSKVFSNAIFEPNIKQKAAKKHADILSLSHLSKLPNIGLYVIPADQPSRPLVILVGPTGSKKGILIKNFENHNSRIVTRLINHTTRAKFKYETNDDFYFVSQKEFDKLLEAGEFLIAYETMNNKYGLTQEEFIKKSAETGKVMILEADIYAALALRIRGFQPVLVLAMPKYEDIHRFWLSEIYGIHNKRKNRRYSEAPPEYNDRENVDFTEMSDSKSEINMNTLYNSYNSVENEVLRKLTNYLQSSPNIEYELDSNEENSLIPDKKLPCKVNIKSDIDLYKNVIQSRDVYVEFHLSNPGVFYETLYTDELETAMYKLRNLIVYYTYKMALIATKASEKRKPPFLPDDILERLKCKLVAFVAIALYTPILLIIFEI
ncbi:uncharacterized protein CBL_09373 [Carabus blaptoides fortunei]